MTAAICWNSIRGYAKPFAVCPHEMKQASLAGLAIILYALHQDFWFWRSAEPLVFGFIPVGLFYHALFTLAASLLMLALVKHAWPSHLEEQIEREEGGAR